MFLNDPVCANSSTEEAPPPPWRLLGDQQLIGSLMGGATTEVKVLLHVPFSLLGSHHLDRGDFL